MDDQQRSGWSPDRGMTYRVGAATLRILNVGDALWTLAEELGLRDDVRREAPDLFSPQAFPSQCVLIQTGGTTLLVDAGAYEYAPGSPEVPPGYVAPPDLLAQLAAHGVRPADVDHVVITHPHFDHLNGLTRRQGEAWQPSFPRARHSLSRADWEQPELREALADPETLEARTLGVVHAQGLLTLVEGACELAPGVRIEPAAGETPGHQLVRVASAGAVAYCVGDLYDSAWEVARPEWMATWVDRAAMRASRRKVERAALAERALLIAAHITGAGRLERRQDGHAVWQPVT